MHNNMTADQAIQIALTLLKDVSLAQRVDLTKPQVRFINSAETMEAEYIKFPHLRPKRRHPNYWAVTFRYFIEDVLGRDDVTVVVYPDSGKAKLLMG